jgi:hypothetical protein
MANERKQKPDLASAVIAVAVGVALIFLAELITPDGWELAAVIIGVLIMLGGIIGIIKEVQHRQGSRAMAVKFPGFEGERFPVCQLLRYEGPDGATDFDTSYIYSLCVTPTILFFVRNRDASDFDGKGGEFVPLPFGDRYAFVRRGQIAGVDVVELEDGVIRENARDTRPAEEKIAEAAAFKLFGMSSPTKVVPFAAYLMLRVEKPQGPALFVMAVPTEVRSHVLEVLGEQVEDDLGVGRFVGDKIGGFAGSKVQEGVGAVIGDGVTDFLSGALDVLGTEGHSVGSTEGETARRAAHLIARRIRALAAATGTG